MECAQRFLCTVLLGAISTADSQTEANKGIPAEAVEAPRVTPLVIELTHVPIPFKGSDAR